MANLFEQKIGKKELLKRIGNINQIAYIRPIEMIEGRSKGIKAFDVNTGGGLQFSVLEGKCLDISEMKYKGINLSYLTKPGVVASEYFNPMGSEFLRFFQAGMLYTCGLRNVGAPCVDDGEELNLHGRIGNTPAEKVGISAQWMEDEYQMEISGEMREAAMFRENLVLKRKISTQMGAKFIKIVDEVENQGFEEQPLMILYHFNFGYPLLDNGTRILMPSLKITSRDEISENGIKEFEKITEPIDGFIEHVFYHEIASDAQGYANLGIVNDRLGLGVHLKYNAQQLPKLNEWKCIKSGDYTLAFEPANCNVDGRAIEKINGKVHTIAPFQSAKFEIEVGIVEGIKEIKALEECIATCRGQ
jgi:hypothetical protein